MADVPAFPGFSGIPSPPSPGGGGGGGSSGFPGIAVPFLDNPPPAATDTNGAANTVVEGALVNSLVGITANSVDADGQTVTYSIGADSSGGGFKIDPTTGVVSVADPSKINFETAAGHAYTITVNSNDGFISTPQTFTIAVTDVAPTVPVDSNLNANVVLEGAAVNSTVGVTAASTDINGPGVTYSLTGDTSGGGFKVDPVTGVVSVADGTKIDFESSPGHAYTVTVQASDGTLTNSQTFTIAVGDVPLSTPVDNDFAANSVAEGAANGSTVGITAQAFDPNGPVTTYSLIADSSLGGFTINATTGVVTIADSSKIDYETSGAGHGYSITVQAHSGVQNTTQSFTVGVTNVAPSAPVDSNGDATNNNVVEGTAAGQIVGLTASSLDINGPAVSYSLIDDAGGRFAIDPVTGVVMTGPNANLIDFETSGGTAFFSGSYNITVQASDGSGGTSTATFSILVTDAPPTNWTDADGSANSVIEGATNGSATGIVARAFDPNGGHVTYSFAPGGDANGAFAIDPATGAITVADGTKIDFESAAGHAYTLTVQGTDDSGHSTTNNFVVNVTNVAPSQPTGTGGTVAEGATAGSPVGLTAHSDDVNGGAISYSLSNSAGGLFTIDASTGAVSVTAAGATGIDYESTAAAGHKYVITVDASDGTASSSQNFTIDVTNAPPSQPTDSDGVAGGSIALNAADGTPVGITFASSDPNGGAVTYSLTGSTAPAGTFVIDPNTGVVTLAAGHPPLTPATTYTITGVANDGLVDSAPQTFNIFVANNALNIDLDASDNTAAGNNYAATYGEQAAALSVTDTDDVISNTGNPGVTTATSAKVVLTNAQAGDVLTVNGSAATSGSLIIGGETINFTKTVSAGSITVDLSGSATYAHYQTALHDIAFSNTSDAPNTIARIVNVTVTDSTGTSPAAVATIGVTPANDAPVLTLGPAGAVTFTEKAAATALFSTGSVADPDLPANFNGGSFTVQITGNASAGDQIVLTGAGFSVSGSSILLGGTTIGSIHAGTGLGTSLVTIDLNASATSGVVNQLVDAFGFQNTSNNPATADRTVSFTFNDGGNTGTGGALASNTVTQTVHVTAVNDAPVASNGSASGNEDNPISGTAIATDVDSPSLTYSLIGANGGAQHGTVTFTNPATGAYTYTPTGDFNGTDTFTFKANDGSLDSNNATITVTVNPVNDAPVLAANASTAPSFTEKGAATQLLSAGTVTDPDNPADFTGGGLTVAIQGPEAGDQIVVLASSGFSVADDGVGGHTLVLNGHSIGSIAFGAGSATVSGLTAFATAAVVNQLVEAFGYQNSLDNFDTTSRHVDITFNDGGNTGGGALASNTLTQTITLTSVNDAPVNHVPTTAQVVGVGANLVFSTGNGNAISVTDDDANGASETVTLTAGTGTLTLNGTAGLNFTTGDGTADTTMTFSGTLADINNALAGLSYTNATAGSDTITMTTNDGGHSGIGGALQDSDPVQIAVTTAPPVEPAIDLNGAAAGTGFENTFTEAGSAAAIVDPAVTIVDTGAGDAIDVIASATITLVNHQANDVLVVNNGLLPAGVTASAYNAATGVLTLTGSGTSTAADFQTALQAITFSNPSSNPSTIDRTITITVNDGTTDSNTAIATVHVTAVNNAPSLDLDADNNHAAGNDFATDYSANGAAVSISDTDVSITDADNANLASATVVLTNAKFGDILSVSGPLPPGITATTTAGAGTITVTLTGSALLADYQSALKQVGFSNSSDTPDQTARDIAVTVNDGTANSNTAHTTITMHPVNHPPVAQNGSASGNEDNAISGSVVATDVDGNTLTYSLVTANGGALHGTVVITDTATGAYTYTPNQDFFGTDSFQFKANDGSLDSNSGTVTVSVAPVNDAPVLDLDSATSVGTNGDDYAAAYTISGTAASVTGTALITDVDDANIASATVTLTNAQSNDVLTINGALPGGIVATTDTSVAGVITVHLTGSATHAQYQAALHQIVFSNGLASPDQTSPDRVITVVVDDGHAPNGPSNTATTTIHITQDTAPVANAKTASATEAGGVNNGTPGVNPAGNVITDAVADSDAEDQISALIVSAIAHGATPGTVGNLLAGDFGSLTINHDGSYSYLVDNANSTVQALRLSTDTLTDSFTYTIRDSAGLTSSNTLVVTIHGADDAPVAVADTASATEAGGIANGTPGVNPTGNVLGNDTDVDTGDSKAVQGVASGTLVGPLNTNVAADVNGSFGKINIANDGTYTYTVDNSNTSVQALRTSAQTLTDTFSYTEKDTAGGTSTTQVTVTIHGQNDNPTAVADGATAVEAGGTNNGTAGSNATGNVLTNDTDPDSVANGETQTVQGVESGSHVADTVSTGAGSPITGAHGTLTLNTNGSFTYVVNNADSTVDALNTGQSTTDTFTYTMHDAANTTSTAVLTVTINGADDAPIAVNQGSAASPAYSAFDAVALNVAAAGVKTGATDVDNTFASLTAVKDTNPAHGSVTVNSDGSFTYTATAGYFGNDSFNYHISDGTLSSNSATAFINVTPHVAYIDNTASAVGEDGSLAHPFASIADFNTANTIANHFDIIYVEKGTGTYTTSAGITLQAGQILEGQGVDPSYVRGDNGQTVVLHDFDNTAGSIATIQVTSGAAVTLNSGNTIQGLNITESGSGAGIIDNGSSVGTFTLSGVHITTGAGAGLSLTHGGTVTATTTVGTNSIASGTGTALNITNTTIGSGNVTFHDISANGAVNGIVLNNTGTSGHLAVTGTGTTAGSGGTIQNTTGDSISLTSTQDVNLADMNVTGSKGYGIIGHTVNGIVLSHDSVSGSGDSTANDGEGNIYLYELTGSAGHATTFDSLSVTNAYVHNVFIENTGGTLTDLQVTNSTFSNNGASTHAGDEFQIILSGAGLAGSPTATVHATHDTFSGNLSTPATFTATGFAGSADDGTLNVHVGDGTAGGLNTFDNNDSGITINATNTGNINFDINDNTVNHNRAVGITANNQGSGVLTGFIRNNVVGQQGVMDSGAAIGDAIDIDDEGTGASHVTTLAITNNIIQSVGDTTNKLGFHGINVIKQSGTQNTSGVLNLTVTGNTIRDIWNDRGLLITDMNTAGNSSMNLDVENNTFSNANAQGGNTTARIGGAPGGTDHVNVTQASAAALAAANGLTASNSPGNNMRVDTNVFFSHAAPALPPATPQMALNGQGPGSTDTLTMNELAPLLLAAVQHWAAAGASAAQIALLENTHIFINDLPNSGILANTDANGITIDTNGAGWGWFIDPTPGSNSEFGVAMTPHDFMATSGDAAGHIDLLTVIEHEMGHVLGLDDSNQPGIMNVNLDTGERREPDSADVAQPPPLSAPAAAASTAGQTFNAGQGGHTFVATAGPDTFVFANVDYHAPAPPPVTLIQNYSFAQGDKFDFSAITSQFHASGLGDGMIVRAVEDASGKFASLQVDTIDPHGLPGQPNWVTVAQIDGAHTGDAVNVLIDGAAVHLTQLHVGLLA